MWRGQINAPSVGLGADPTQPLQAATKQYVDASDNLKVAKAGDTMTGNLTFSTDGQGVFTNSGGAFYKKIGTGLTIRAHSSNTQPGIENNDGSNRRDIIDTVNGDARYATSAQVNARVLKTGDTMTGTLSIGGGGIALSLNDNWLRLYKSNYTVGSDYPAIAWGGPGGRDANANGAIRLKQTGAYSYYGPATQMEFSTAQAGYGPQIFMTSSGRNDLRITGQAYAQGVLLTSDTSLKEEITPIDPVLVAPAFDAIAPVRYKWKPTEINNPLSATGKSPQPRADPDRLHWGFLADDIRTIAEDAVYEDPDTGLLSYDPIALLAITITQLQETKREVAELKIQMAARA